MGFSFLSFIPFGFSLNLYLSSLFHFLFFIDRDDRTPAEEIRNGAYNVEKIQVFG